MYNALRTKKGFTIVEVLVSLGMMIVFLPIVASIIFTNQFLASYSKHKIQAAYAAQQIIETQRQQAVLNGVITNQVILDTHGNFINPAECFYGTATTTVTPAVYSSNPNSPNNNVAHVVVVISWPEQILTGKITMKETYAADIILNDTILN